MKRDQYGLTEQMVADQPIAVAVGLDEPNALALLRGQCVHWVRYGMKHRHAMHAATARLLVRGNVLTLRALGGGPVQLPRRQAGGLLGAPLARLAPPSGPRATPRHWRPQATPAP